MNLSPFCSCGDKNCPLNPVNHEKGCSLCVEKCLRQGEIPSCFFNAVSTAPVDHSDYSYNGFANHVRTHMK